MNLETELRSLVEILRSRIETPVLEELVDFIDVGEYGVGLEYLCDQLFDAETPLRIAEVQAIQQLAAEMGLERPSIQGIVAQAIN